jgi:hypothetical protein
MIPLPAAFSPAVFLFAAVAEQQQAPTPDADAKEAATTLQLTV